MPKMQSELRFKDDLPAKYIQLLINKYGFKYHSRTVGHHLTYRKTYERVTEGVVDQLTRECVRRCEEFVTTNDVFERDKLVSGLTTWAWTKTPIQRQWVLMWIKKNVTDLTDDELPW